MKKRATVAVLLSCFVSGLLAGGTVADEIASGVERFFISISAAAEEATLSRIFGGQHFRFDLTTGQRLGREVADFVLDNFLTSAHRADESDHN